MSTLYENEAEMKRRQAPGKAAGATETATKKRGLTATYPVEPVTATIFSLMTSCGWWFVF
jgi:hypothetical protein